MRREPIVRSAIAVVLTWAVIFGLLNRDTAWQLIQSGYVNILMTAGLLIGSAVIGFFLALWLSSEEHDARINQLIPKPQRGMQASIGAVPLHTRPEKGWQPGLNLADPAASLAFAFKTLRESEDLVPMALRRSPSYQDGIDLQAIEQYVFKLPSPHIALFDAVLRVFMARPTLLTTYEQEGHGRHNGQGGRTLLQHSLLVCQCAIEMAPKWSYEGMRTITKEGLPGEVVYQPRQKAQLGYAQDPLVALIGLAHDIGKIQCYQWRDGESEPYALAPNHDLIGARMLAILPQTWALSDHHAPDDPAQADPQVLITAVAFYHHPSEQPMDGAGIKPGSAAAGKNRIILDLGGVQIRSDRQVALMELLIAADKKAGSIEHQSVRVDSEQEDGATDLSAATQATTNARTVSVEAALWEAIETTLLESGRLNAKQMRGIVTSMSVGTRHLLPDWGGPVLILKEDDFVKAVIGRADLAQDKRDFYFEEINHPSERGNVVNQATLAVLRVLHAQGMLLTPPGMPSHTPETSLWKIVYHEPGHVYPDGLVTQPRFPEISAAPLFRWGSAIICAPARALPAVAAGEVFHLVPVCIGNRLGNQGNLTKKSGAANRPRKSVFDDADEQLTPSAAPVALAQNRSKSERGSGGALVQTFIGLLQSGLRQGTFTTLEDAEGRLVIDTLLDEIAGLLGMRTSMDEVVQLLTQVGDDRLALEEANDTSGRRDYRVILLGDWGADLPQPPRAQEPESVTQEAPEESDGPPELEDEASAMADPTLAFDEEDSDDQELTQEPPQAPDIPDLPAEAAPEETPMPVPTPMPASPPPPKADETEDSYVAFQRSLAAYLRRAGAQALAKKRDKTTGLVTDYAVKGPADELFQKLGFEEALIEWPEDPLTADLGVIVSSSGLRILRISPSWLERRDLTPVE